MDLHQSFLWLHPAQAKFAIFRVPTCTLYLRPTDNAVRAGLWCAAAKPRIPYQLTKASLHVHYALRFCNPVTRAHVRLLGPCFKTGRMGNRLNAKAEYHSSSHQNTRTDGSGPETGGPSAPAQMPAVNKLEAGTLSITVEATALNTQARHSLPK